MLIVQKYGGTSVGTLERIDEVAKRVIENKNISSSCIKDIFYAASEEAIINLSIGAGQWWPAHFC